MRISLIGPVFPYRGGIAHFTTLMAQKLREEGYEVQMISFKNQYPIILYPGKSDKDFSPGRIKVDADFILSPLNPFTWIKTASAIRDFNPQKVVIPWWTTFWSFCFSYIMDRLKKEDIGTTILIHNTLPHEPRQYDKWLARQVLSRADKFIVMSSKEKGRLLAFLPTASEIIIVPHPISIFTNPTNLSREAILQKLGLPEGKKFVLFFGFIRDYKGLHDLIRAMRFCVNEDPNIHLIIAGEFWNDKAAYLEQIAQEELQPFIHIFDEYIPDDEVSVYFEVSDIFAAPYTGGTQSAAIKTALGFGLPVVLTRIISDDLIEQLPELCNIVPTSDPKLFAESILAQLKKGRISENEIEILFDKSWHNLSNAATQD